MRFVYVILLGMIILNGVFIIIAPFFPYPSGTIETIEESATDIADTPTYSSYADIDAIDILAKSLLTGGFIFGFAIIATILTRNPVFIGVGAFVGIFILLWGNLSQPIVSTLNQYSAYGVSIYDLFMVCFGIVIVISVVEIFTGQKGVEG